MSLPFDEFGRELAFQSAEPLSADQLMRPARLQIGKASLTWGDPTGISQHHRPTLGYPGGLLQMQCRLQAVVCGEILLTGVDDLRACLGDDGVGFVILSAAAISHHRLE